MLLLFIACGKNEFFFEFDLSAEITENYNVTYYATDTRGGLTIQAVASVREGKCELKGLTKKPTLAYITARKSDYPLVVYAEKGEKIIIKGDSNNPLEWQVDEGEINRILTSWRKENLSFLQKNMTDSVNIAVKEFVENNPGNAVSLILMQCYFSKKEDEKEYVRLMGVLSGEAISENWKKIIGRTDHVLAPNNYPARLESLILRSINESADTLMINGKNPVFLLFWQTGDNDHKNMVDSMKKLIKEFPDTNRLLADVCLDIDSLGWRNSIRRDSLEKTRRFWAPMGMADPTMTKLKVTSVPYFIVFDKKGNQSYRGEDLGEAMKEYRHLYKDDK